MKYIGLIAAASLLSGCAIKPNSVDVPYAEANPNVDVEAPVYNGTYTVRTQSALSAPFDRKYAFNGDVEAYLSSKLKSDKPVWVELLTSDVSIFGNVFTPNDYSCRIMTSLNGNLVVGDFRYEFDGGFPTGFFVCLDKLADKLQTRIDAL